MRRSRAVLILLSLLLLVLAGYSYFWMATAGRLRQAVEDWAAAQRSRGANLSWSGLTVRGYPFAFEIALRELRYGDREHDVPYEFASPELSGQARPWDLRRWRLAAEKGGELRYGPPPAPGGIRAAAARLGGSYAPHQPGMDEVTGPGADVALDAEQIVVTGQSAATIARARLSAVLPDAPPADHRQTALSGGLAIAGLTFPPEMTTPLGATVQTVTAQFALRGAVPPGPRAAALASWRDGGGTLELESFAIDWGALAGRANGTLSLDGEMQPIGALTASIAGYAETIDALVAAQNIKPGDGEIAKVALGLLAKPGPEGRPVLTQPISLQNNSLYLGPARLMRLPRVSW